MDVVDGPESAAPSVGAGDTAESAELARRMDELRASPAAVALRELDASVRLCPGDAYFYDEALGQVVVQRKATFVAYGLGRGAAAPPPRGVLVGATACRLAVSSLDGSLLAVQVSETLVLVAEADGPRRWRVEVRGGAPGVGAFLERLAGGGGGGGDGAPRVVPGGVLWSDPVCKSNLQPDFNLRVIERFDTSTSTVLRELDESNRSVQKSAESTSI